MRRIRLREPGETYRAFYEADDNQRFGREEMPEQRRTTLAWLERSGMNGDAGIVLELGCGKGPLAGIHTGYVGVEFSRNALRRFTSGGVRVNGDMQELPLRSESVSFVFSWAALEHVPRPELVLNELTRILKPGGVALLAPAWNCRPWAAKGLPVRPYRSLSWKDRLVKASIPLREMILWRAAWAIPARLLRESRLLVGGHVPFQYRRLKPNLTEYVYTDCDAFTSMDPHAAIIYFESRGWHVLSHLGLWARLTSRHEPVVVRKPLVSKLGRQP